MISHAIVCPPAVGFDNAIRPEDAGAAIDVRLAREQHDAYARVVAASAGDVIRLEPDERYPDCCFVEDPVVVAGDRAVICNMAAQSRRGEGSAIRDALAPHKQIVDLQAPATLDGGDVVHIARRLYVGMSSRSNMDAVEQLRTILGPDGYVVTPVPVSGVLHLKSAATYIGAETVVACAAYVDPDIFQGCRVIDVPVEESYAANCLGLGGVVVVSDGFVRTRDAIAGAGFETASLAMTEFRKAGGSLTCLSVLF